MEHKSLHAPWRMSYIRSLEHGSDEGCFLCLAGATATRSERKGRLVLWTTPLTVVLLNRFPYTNGHCLLAPRRHVAEYEEMTREEVLDLGEQTQRLIGLLRRAVAAQGFNVGVNLGRCAGAGLPGHLHQHVVPRWSGDVNFMGVVGDVRIIPEANDHIWQELEAAANGPTATNTKH